MDVKVDWHVDVKLNWQKDVYRILPNKRPDKRPGRIRNWNQKFASFYCFFAIVSLKTSNFSYNSL